MGKRQLPELKNNDYAEVSKTAVTPVATRGSKTILVCASVKIPNFNKITCLQLGTKKDLVQSS